MYIRFKVQDGGSANGGYGLQAAIDWAMTASAGATASVATFAGSYQSEVTDFEVISNDEAGGWTNYDAVSSSSSSYSWRAGWEADSPKTGRNFKKRWEVGTNTTSSSHTNNWGPKGGLYDSDNSSYILAMTSQSYYTSTNSTANGYSWFRTLNPDDLTWGWWNLSVTSKYVWFWPDSNINSTAGCRYMAGMADLAGTPQYLLNAISDNVASVGFYSSSTDSGYGIGTSTSTSYYNDFIQYYFANIDGMGPTSTQSATNGMLTQSGSSPSISATAIPWQIHPPHYYNIISNSQECFLPTFDEYGTSVGGLTPITIMSPLKGVPPQTIEGIYYYMPRRVVNTTEAQNWASYIAPKYNNRIIYDENGDKYRLWHAYGSMHIKAIRAM